MKSKRLLMLSLLSVFLFSGFTTDKPGSSDEKNAPTVSLQTKTTEQICKVTVVFSDPITFVSMAGDDGQWRDGSVREFKAGEFVQIGAYGPPSLGFKWYDNRTGRLLFQGDPYQFYIDRDMVIRVEY